MKDPEFILLRNRFFIAVIVTLIFVVPLGFFVFNRFANQTSELLKNIKEEKNVIIFLTSNKCSQCSKIKEILDSNNVAYFELNKDKDTDYKEILFKIDLQTNFVETPGIVYVENGKLSTNVMAVEEKLAQSFLENHNLVNTRK